MAGGKWKVESDFLNLEIKMLHIRSKLSRERSELITLAKLEDHMDEMSPSPKQDELVIHTK